MKNVFRKSFSLLLCAVMLATSFNVSGIISYASENTAHYNLYVYEMDVDGNYFESVIRTDIAEIGSVVVAESEMYLKDGFRIDEERSILTAVVSDDDTTVLEVYLERNRYMLSLDYNEGECNGYFEYSVMCYYEGIVPPVQTPCREGYTFMGWCDENGNLIEELPQIMPCRDITLTAVWECIPYRLELNANGGCFDDIGYEIKEVTFEYGMSVDFGQPPTRIGYTFEGWSKDISATEPEYYGYEEFRMPCEDITLYAVWTPVCWKAIWMVDGAEYMHTIYEYDSMIEAPYETPQKPGYYFAGWQDANGNIYDDYYIYPMPAENVYFNAVFEPDEQVCTVEFYFEDLDGNFILDENRTIAFKALTDSVAIYEPEEIEGFTFDYDISITSIPVSGEEQTILKIYYRRNRYILTFDACEGYFHTPDQTVIECDIPYDAPLPTVENPLRVGYAFCGWNRYPETMPAQNVVLTAVWKAMEFSAEWYANGEFIDTTVSEYGDYIEVPYEQPVRTGYIFKGWATEEWSDTVVNIEEMTMPADGISFYAVFVPCNDTLYAVETFFMDTEGNYEWHNTEYFSGVTDMRVNYEPLAHQGFTFDPYHSVTEGVISPDGTLVLRVFYERNRYKFNFECDGCITTEEFYYGALVEEPSPPCREGYCFDGWFEEYGGVNRVHFPYTMPDCDVTLHAGWVINMYNLRFADSNGDELGAYCIPYGEDITDLLWQMIPEKYGYTFAGWSVVRNSSEPDFFFSDYYAMPCYDLTLYAVWSVNMYMTVWRVDSEIFAEIPVFFDCEIPFPDTYPTKQGYVFAGWEDQQGNIWDGYYSAPMPAEEITFRAVFVPCDDTLYTVRIFEMDLNGYYTEYVETHAGVTDETVYADFGNYLKEGFYFNENMSTTCGVIQPDGSLELSLYFDRLRYNVTFEFDNPGMSDLTVELMYGEIIEQPAVRFKEGHTFAGWTPELPAVMPAEDITVTAVWQVNQYFIRWIVDDIIFHETIYCYGDTITAPYPEFEKPGYVFVGWEPYVPVTMPAQDLEIRAVWELSGPIKYLVETYIMDTDGTYNMTAAYHSVRNVEDVSIEPVIPEGFVLNEESSVLSGFADVYNELVLKVYLDRLPFEFIMIIDGESYTTEYLYGSIIPEPATPIKDGYIFTEWDGEIPDKMPANDVTVTANFRKITPEDNINHAISFYITPLNNVTLNYGESIKMYAYTRNLPENYKIKWSVDTNNVTIKPSANGRTCTVTCKSTGGAAISAWIVDENGNVVKDENGNSFKDTEIIYTESNTWLRILDFFRKLFGFRI